MSNLKLACKENFDKLFPHYEPSLFQHNGVVSSLKGKFQNLKVNYDFF